MRKVGLLFSLILLALLPLSGCGENQRILMIHGVEYAFTGESDGVKHYEGRGGANLTVLPEADGYRILWQGESYFARGSRGEIEVAFPDGVVLGEKYRGDLSTGYTRFTSDLEREITWEDWDLVESFYTCLFASPGRNLAQSGGLPLLGLVIAAAGAFGLARPGLFWWLDIGWKVKHAEPSRLGLAVARVAGFIFLVAGLALFIITIS